jgi:hypothetical protein
MKQFVAALAIVSLSAMSVYAGTTKGTAPDLPTSNPYATIDVIVQFKVPATVENLSSMQSLGHVSKQFTSIPAVRMSLPCHDHSDLAEDALRKYISPSTFRPTANRSPVMT